MSQSQSYITIVKIRDNLKNKIYMERAAYLVFWDKLLIILDKKFNLFINKIFA